MTLFLFATLHKTSSDLFLLVTKMMEQPIFFLQLIIISITLFLLIRFKHFRRNLEGPVRKIINYQDSHPPSTIISCAFV